MKPYFSNKLCTIYHGDNRELLPQLLSESVDLVLTDPPYGIGYYSKNTSAEFNGQKIQGDKDLNLLRDIMPQLDRILKKDRHAYVFASPKRMGEAWDAITAVLKAKEILVWDKGNAGSRGDCQAGYSRNWEGIIYASKGRRPLNRPRPRAIFRYDWQSWKDPVHPTAKPLPVLSWLINHSSNPGELLIDPCMGSGTTLKAAMEIGRRCIGIEIEEEYCEIAAGRLTQQLSKTAA